MYAHQGRFPERLPPLVCLLLYAVAVSVGVFMGGLWATLGIGGAVLLYVSASLIAHRWSAPDGAWAGLFLATICVMALLNIISSDPYLSWKKWIELATIALPLLLLSSRDIRPYIYHPKFFAVLTVAIVLGATALCLELYCGAPLLAHFDPRAAITKYNRGFSYLVLMAFPVMAALWNGDLARKKSSLPFLLQPRVLFFVGFVLILLIPAGMTESRAAKLALVIGLGIAASAAFMPRLTPLILAVIPFLAIGWPFAAQSFFAAHEDWLKSLPDSWHARIEIWDYMSHYILERPWLGWGLDTSHTLSHAVADSGRYVFTTFNASHPHNVVIELWVELGLPGLAFGLAFALLTLRGALRCGARHVPFALGAWAAALCLSLVAYDFWTDSLLAALALTGFCFALLDEEKASSGGGSFY